MANNPSLVIRVAGSIAELKKNLTEGLNQIEVTTAGMKKLAASLDGNKLIQNAHNIVAAVNEIGGATKLTEAEKARLNVTLSKAIEKYGVLGKEAPKAMRDLAAATERIEPPLTLADKAAGLLKSTFGQFTAANLVSQAVSSITQRVGEFVATGAKLPAVEASFSRLTGGINQNSGQMLAAMNTATQGMVADYDLMLSANKAMLLGLPVTTQSMGELARTARVLGKAMGQDATKSLDDLITALGRSSPLILDNLGLTVKVGEANEGYAAKLGKTADQLSDADRKLAFYEAAMEAARKKTAELGEQTKTLGEIIETGWTKVGNVITRSAATMNVGIGNALSSAKNLAMFLTDVMSYGPGIATLNAEMRDQIQNAARRTEDIVLPLEKVADLSKVYADHLATLKEKTAALTDEQKRLILRATELHQSSGDIAKALGLEEAAVTATVEAHRQAADATKKHADELKKLNTEIVKFASEEFRDLQKILAGGVGAPNLATLESNRGAAPFAPPVGLSSNNPAAGLFNSARFMGFGSEFAGQYGATPNEINQGASGFFSNVVGGIRGGLKNTLLGMTGTDAAGKSLGAAGLFSNIGGGLLSGGLNSLMNLAVGGLGKLVGNLFNSEGKQTNRERDQDITGFTGISDLRGAQDEFRRLATEAGVADTVIAHVFSTKKTKDFEASFKSVTEKIKQFTDEQAADQQRLTEAIQKYGFTIEELGPKLQKQRLDALAKDLIEDWRVLADAGIDVSVVNERMSDAINGFLTTALQVGAEVPAAMRPILQSMVDQGKLFDANGNKIEDLQAAGITFSETMTQGFDRVVKKLDELITRLGMAGSAIANLPSTVNVDVPSKFSDFVPDRNFMAAGGSGRVYGPTVFVAGEAGPEDYSFSGANRRFGEGASSGGVLTELRNMNRRLERVQRDQPRAIAIAVKNAIALA